MAPELSVSQWFNTPEPLSIAALKGRVIFLHSFQLLCPGCVAHAIPQVQRIERTFSGSDLQIIGLHTVFEHHAAMSPTTLEAFLFEYRLNSPVGVDLADEASHVPVTMRRYGFRGTPSSVLIGRDGTILHEAFGIEDDLTLGARIATALATPVPDAGQAVEVSDCAAGVCALPVSI
ncbi:TlpA family protein disulfide reductase [Azorhizobium oxalatiphilum]|nr:TlpA family protein disulfide reductase [Azorhizobium oxalatiphilum]